MNWSRTKTWLIVLFIGINLFLLFTIVKEQYAQSTISEQAIRDTVAVLERNGINIDAQIIPRKMPSLSAIEVINTVTDQVRLAEKLTDGAVTYDEESTMYLRGSCAVMFEGDTIRYANSSPDLHDLYDNKDGAVAYARQFLTDKGFDLSKADVKVVSYTEDDKAYIIFTQKLDSYPLMDSYFRVWLTDEGIAELEGCWFYMATDQSGSSGAHGRVKEVTSVLIDFINDENRAETSTEIESITLGYTTGDKNTYHKAVSAMPAWCITTTDGNSYFYDAH